jgi:hypothetical protein
MAGTGRIASAIVLALAFATAPIVFDQCAAACELAHLMNASAGAERACHHASPIRHIGERRGACAHDHARALMAVTSAAPVARRTPNLVPFVAPVPDTVDVRVVVNIEHIFVSPPSSPASPQRSLSLRI